MMKSMRSFMVLALSFALFSFIFLNTATLFYMSGMDDHQHCPLMPGSVVICSMDAFEHIRIWQGFLRSLPSEGLVLGLFLSALVAAFFSIFERTNLMDRGALRSRARFHHLAFAYVPVTPLSEAFSQGILHTKAF